MKFKKIDILIAIVLIIFLFSVYLTVYGFIAKYKMPPGIYNCPMNGCSFPSKDPYRYQYLGSAIVSGIFLTVFISKRKNK